MVRSHDSHGGGPTTVEGRGDETAGPGKTATEMGGLRRECEKGRGGGQVEGEVGRDNSWGGAAVPELNSPIYKGKSGKG